MTFTPIATLQDGSALAVTCLPCPYISLMLNRTPHHDHGLHASSPSWALPRSASPVLASACHPASPCLVRCWQRPTAAAPRAELLPIDPAPRRCPDWPRKTQSREATAKSLLCHVPVGWCCCLWNWMGCCASDPSQQLACHLRVPLVPAHLEAARHTNMELHFRFAFADRTVANVYVNTAIHGTFLHVASHKHHISNTSVLPSPPTSGR